MPEIQLSAGAIYERVVNTISWNCAMRYWASDYWHLQGHWVDGRDFLKKRPLKTFFFFLFFAGEGIFRVDVSFFVAILGRTHASEKSRVFSFFVRRRRYFAGGCVISFQSQERVIGRMFRSLLAFWVTKMRLEDFTLQAVLAWGMKLPNSGRQKLPKRQKVDTVLPLIPARTWQMIWSGDLKYSAEMHLRCLHILTAEKNIREFVDFILISIFALHINLWRLVSTVIKQTLRKFLQRS